MAVPCCSLSLPVQWGFQSAKTGHTQTRCLRVALSLPSVHTCVLSPTPCSDPLGGHPLRVYGMTMAIFVVFTSRGKTGHCTPSPPLPSQPPQARIATVNSRLYCVPFCDIDLHPCRWPPMVCSPSERRISFDVQRFVSVFFPPEYRVSI